MCGSPRSALLLIRGACLLSLLRMAALMVKSARSTVAFTLLAIRPQPSMATINCLFKVTF